MSSSWHSNFRITRSKVKVTGQILAKNASIHVKPNRKDTRSTLDVLSKTIIRQRKCVLFEMTGRLNYFSYIAFHTASLCACAQDRFAHAR